MKVFIALIALISLVAGLCPKEPFWRDGKCGFFAGGVDAVFQLTQEECCNCPRALIQGTDGSCYTPSRVSLSERIIVSPKCCEGSFRTLRHKGVQQDDLPEWIAENFPEAQNILEEMDQDAGIRPSDRSEDFCGRMCSTSACYQRCVALKV